MNLDQTLEFINKSGDNDLFILWTNADIVTANLMVFMYAENAAKQKLWDNIMIIIWGATTKLVAENKEIQQKISKLQELGVKFSACISCAKELNVETELEALGVDLIKWLYPMTELIKGQKHLITI